MAHSLLWNPEHSIPEASPTQADMLPSFRESRGLPIEQWPHVLVPSTTVIVIAQTTRGNPWRILLQQRRDNGWWGLPGGRQEIGESIQACAVRECLEETGYHVALERLVSIDSDPLHGAISVYPDGKIVQYTCVTFLGTVIGGTLRCSPESTCVDWFAVEALPSPLLPSHAWRLGMAQQTGSVMPVR